MKSSLTDIGYPNPRADTGHVPALYLQTRRAPQNRRRLPPGRMADRDRSQQDSSSPVTQCTGVVQVGQADPQPSRDPCRGRVRADGQDASRGQRPVPHKWGDQQRIWAYHDGVDLGGPAMARIARDYGCTLAELRKL